MTSNLASDEIAEYSVHLREEAKQKQQVELEKGKDKELTERITISKRFLLLIYSLYICFCERYMLNLSRRCFYISEGWE